MHLDLTDDEAAALTQELHDIVENDRYPFSRSASARIRPSSVSTHTPCFGFATRPAIFRWLRAHFMRSGSTAAPLLG
jgi:hypothetical protein